MQKRSKTGLTVKQLDAMRRRAHGRYLRRCQLWHAERQQFPDNESFLAVWPEIAARVAETLAREYPEPAR